MAKRLVKIFYPLIPKARITLLCFLLSGGLPAAEVFKVTPQQDYMSISHEPSEKWQLKDYVCANLDGMPAACGVVWQSLPNYAVVQISFWKVKVVSGMLVERHTPPPSDISESYQSIEKIRESQKPLPYIGRNRLLESSDSKPSYERLAMVGMLHLAPSLHYQVGWTEHFSFGLLGTYFFSPLKGVALRGMGGFLTAHYFEAPERKGLAVLGGVGYYQLKNTSTSGDSNYGVVSLLVNVGWRWHLSSVLRMGLAVGAHFNLPSRSQTISNPLPTVFPIIALDIGLIV